jgi:hypothetical protein
MSTPSATRKDSPEIPKTLEEAMKLLGWEEIPGIEDPSHPDRDLEEDFLWGLANYIRKRGLDWVKANQDTVRWSWEALLVAY